MPIIKGLDILNDSEENQKLVQKPTDWAASQWNWQMSKSFLTSKALSSSL